MSSFTPVQDCIAYLRHLKWALNSLNVFDSSLWQFVFAFSPIGTFLLHLCINVQHYIIFTKQNKLSCNIFVGSHAEKKSKTKLSFTPNSLMMSFFSIFWGEIGLWSRLRTKEGILSITGLLTCVPLGISSIVQCEQWFQQRQKYTGHLILSGFFLFRHPFSRRWSTAPKTCQQCQNFYQMSGWLRLRM